MPATFKSLLHLTEIIPPGSTWSVIGVGASPFPITAVMGMMTEGNVRVGLKIISTIQKGRIG